MFDPLAHSIASVMVALACALFIWPLYLMNKDFAGTKQWAIGNSLMPIGLLFLSSQGKTPVWFSVVLANHLILAAVLLTLWGVRLFFSLKNNKKAIATIALSFSLPFLYFTYVTPYTDARIIIVSVMFATCSLLNVLAIRTTQKQSFSLGAKILQAVLILLILLMCYRILYLLFIGELGSVFTKNLLNTAVAALSYFVTYGLTLSYFLLCSERRIQMLDTLQQQTKTEAALKSRFLASLSHELRTPLNAIVGKAQLMRLQQQDPQLQQDCSIIIDAGLALSTMAQQVLEHASLEHGEVQIQPQDTLLIPWLQSIIDTMQPLAQARHLALTLQTERLNAQQIYRFDQGKVRQVLINLLGNAIKYTDHGFVRLQVQLTDQSGPQHSIHFAVKDSGIGINPDDQRDILTPFIRASQQELREGTGLGLSLCQKALQLLGTELTFTSQPGVGSCFYFQLPLTPISASDPIATDASSTIPPLHILLIEDVELNQHIIKALLQHDGHLVLVAATAADALDLCQQHSFELILLDMNLPDSDGLSLFRQLQQQLTGPLLNTLPPVLALTADTSWQLQQDCLAAGITQVLTKPVELAQLQQSIRQLLPWPLIANSLTFQSFACYLPAQLVQQKLARLAAELQQQISQWPSLHGAELQANLHQLRGMAATLGLELLAAQLAELESQPDLVLASQPAYSQLAGHSAQLLRQKIEGVRHD
jgi:hypothetical protein